MMMIFDGNKKKKRKNTKIVGSRRGSTKNAFWSGG